MPKPPHWAEAETRAQSVQARQGRRSDDVPVGAASDPVPEARGRQSGEPEARQEGGSVSTLHEERHGVDRDDGQVELILGDTRSETEAGGYHQGFRRAPPAAPATRRSPR